MADEAGDSIMQDATDLVFSGKTIAVIRSDKLSDNTAEEIHGVVANHGGHCVLVDNHSRIPDMAEVDFIVSETTDFPNYFDALDQFKPVVRAKWIEESIQTGETESPRNYSPDSALFLSDVMVFCADLPERDKDAICGGVQAMGGQYSNKLSKFVTHLVALNFENHSCQMVVQKNLKCKVVLPHWFDACFKLGRRVIETPYLLSDPLVLDPEAKAPKETRANNLTLNGASSPRPKHMQPPTAGPIRIASVFQDKMVMLSSQLELGQNLMLAIEEIVTNNGGKMTQDAEVTDMLVCQYRDGEDYVTASRAGKDVGNLSWLYYIISHNRWTSPMRRLLHYPLPRGGIPGFSNYKISLSNYSGEARTFVGSLVEAAGASLDKKMTAEDTHLIAAYVEGAKCEAAQEWGVKMINHLWLEESYASCVEMVITKPKYTHFPRCTNLGEVVGQTQFNRSTLESKYFSAALEQKAKATRAKPQKATQAPAHHVEQHEDNDAVDDMTEVRSAPKKAKRTRSEQALSTPKPRLSSDKENESPLTTGGRGAKAKALSKLHSMAPDIALYEKEQKRKGGVIHGKERRSAESGDDEPPKSATKPSNTSKESRKRSLEPDVDEEQDSERAQTPPKKAKNKKSKSVKTSTTRTYLMVTKYEGWLDDVDKESKDKGRLLKLGIHITTEPKPNMILCAPNIVRTKKFLCALATAPHVVSLDFLEHCLKHDEIPDPEDFALQDEESEAKWGIELEASLRRAGRHQGKLLKDWTIFCTQTVTGGFETYKDIIEANGGTCQLYKGRTSMQVSKREVKGKAIATVESQDQDATAPEFDDKGDIFLISQNTKKEAPLWEKFRVFAKNVDMRPRIVSTEWLLFTALSQKAAYDERFALSEDTVE